MIRVKMGSVKNNGKLYKTGETISSLSEKEEARLISLGFAEKVESENNTDKTADHKNKNVNEMKKIIKAVDNVEELKAMLKDEIESSNRKTVIAAIEERIAELSEPEDDGNDNNNGDSDGLNINFDAADVVVNK